MPRPKERRGLCISGDERGGEVIISLAYSNEEKQDYPTR
jgi:hypothetical protein